MANVAVAMYRQADTMKNSAPHRHFTGYFSGLPGLVCGPSTAVAAFLQARWHSYRPTNSVKALKKSECVD